jgi:hypothetical protein
MLTYVLLGTNDLDRATRFYDATLTLLGSAASPATRMGSPRQAGEPMRMMARANWRSGSESHSMHGIRADLNRGTGPGQHRPSARLESLPYTGRSSACNKLIGLCRKAPS